MAKERDDEGVDEKTLGFLDDVKKGKPRMFAMVCKGAKVVSLVLYKKGSLEKYKKQAKEQGKGSFYHGIADGSGSSMVFKLSKADGFDKEPGPASGLKIFLSEKADLKVQPSYEIVNKLSPPLDVDDPMAALFLKIKPAAMAAISAHPNAAEELTQLCDAIPQLIVEDNAKGAEAKIGELETLLKQLGAGSQQGNAAESGEQEQGEQEQQEEQQPSQEQGNQAAPVAPPAPQAETSIPPAPPLQTPPPPPAPNDRMKEFMPQLKQMLGLLDRAKGSAGASSGISQNIDQAAGFLKQAGALAQQRKVDDAFKLLELTSDLLTTSIEDAAVLKSKAANLRKTVFAEVKPAVEASPVVKDELVALLNEANNFEKAGEFEKAIASYDTLQKKIAKALAGGATTTEENSGLSIMKLGKARIEWGDTRRAAMKSMEELKTAFQAAYADETNMLGEVKAALKKLDTTISQLREDLERELDNVLNETDPARRVDLVRIARRTMNEFSSFVDSDKVMKALDGNEILPKTQITGPIRAKLAEIASALG